jgi:tetratricopeptide (TPR) repeat protein
MKKKVIIWLIVIVVLGGIFYLYQNKENRDIDNFINKIKTDYRVSDFIDSALETSEAQRMVDRLNEAYVYLEEGDKLYLSWIDIGMYKKVLGDYSGAEDAWRSAVALSDNPALAYGNLANLYFYNLRDYIKAEEYYKKALDAVPGSYTYREGLADLYRYDLRNKVNEVEQIMKDGVEKDINNSIAYYAYLVDFFSSENNEEKIKEYTKKIKEIDPNWQAFAEDVVIE